MDEQTGMVLRYAGGELALLACAIRTATPHVARIDGTEGAIEIPAFWHATSARLIRPGQEPEEASGDFGYHYEAAEVMACLREGRTESASMPLDESIAIAETLDQVRAQIGLAYPPRRCAELESLHRGSQRVHRVSQSFFLFFSVSLCVYSVCLCVGFMRETLWACNTER